LVPAPRIYDPGGPVLYLAEVHDAARALTAAPGEAVRLGSPVIVVNQPSDDLALADALSANGYQRHYDYFDGTPDSVLSRRPWRTTDPPPSDHSGGASCYGAQLRAQAARALFRGLISWLTPATRVGRLIVMTSEPDWDTLFRLRRELTSVRNKVLQELQRSGRLFEEDRYPHNDIIDVFERAQRACAAVTTFDQAHPNVVDEDEQWENTQARRFMSEFDYLEGVPRADN
jgi:hypothetical protein